MHFTETKSSWLHLAISGIIFFKDITYVVLYPHLNYWTTLILWMSIIGPLIYIYTRRILADYDIFMTALIYLGYNWKKEEMIAKKRFNLAMVIAFQ